MSVGANEPAKQYLLLPKNYHTMRHIILLIATALLAHTLQAQQPSKEELQRKTQALLSEIEAVKKDLQATQASKKQSLGALRQVEKKLQMRNQVIFNLKTEVWMVEREILKTYREIDTLKKEMNVLKDQYAQSIVYAYKNRSNYDFLNFIFSSTGFSDALRRISYLKTYRSYREQKSADILRANTQLQEKIASLSTNRKVKESAVQAQAANMQELENEKKEKDAIFAEVASREKELNKMVANKERERRQIQAAIAAVIKRERDEAVRAERAAAEARRKAAADAAAKKKEEDAKAIAEGRTPAPAPAPEPAKPVAPTATTPTRKASALEATPEAVLVSQKFEENRGRLPWPIEKGIITLRHGKNAVPAKMRDINVINDGLTFETEIGSNVRAIFDGEVSSVFNVGNHKVIMIKHGKYFTTYSNLSTANVAKGQVVKTGQVIGKAGVNDYGEGEVSMQLDTESGQLNPEPWLMRK